MSQLIESQTDPRGIVTLRLNRPGKRNALNIPMLEALCEAVEHANEKLDVRVVVLRGNGPAFCAGLDLQEATDPARSYESAQLVARMLQAVYHSPKITLAAVHGAALAGGAGLVGACDLCVATFDSTFGFPEVRRGLVAGLVMTFIRRQLQERHARELLLLGEIVGGERAAEIGLVTRCVPNDMLDEQVEIMIDLALQGAPNAIRMTKEWLDATWHHPAREDIEAALELHVKARTSSEAAEGMQAFLEKRPPNWRK